MIPSGYAGSTIFAVTEPPETPIKCPFLSCFTLHSPLCYGNVKFAVPGSTLQKINWTTENDKKIVMLNEILVILTNINENLE